TPPAPTTLRKPPSSNCSMRPTTRTSNSQKASRCTPPPRFRAGTSATPTANTSWSGSSRRTRCRTTRHARAVATTGLQGRAAHIVHREQRRESAHHREQEKHYERDQGEYQHRPAIILLAGMRAPGKSPDEKHHESDNRNRQHDQGDDPVA